MPERDINIIKEYQKEREKFEALSLEKKGTEVERLKEEAQLENAPSFYDKLEEEIDEKQKEQLELTVKIAEAVKEAGGTALVVGGFARDEVLKKFGCDVQPKDIDIEIHGLEPEMLRVVLEQFGKPEIVGSSFGIIKLKGLDISLPAENSHTLDFKEAARRRDFTINALGLNPLTGEILDECGGIDDLKNKTLRMVDPETFKSDPLRVIRAAQFAGRFGFAIDKQTIEFCKTLDLKKIPGERLGEEWAKLLLKSEKPSIGLEAMKELKVLEKLHPELNNLIHVPQDKKHHPEGDVWTHTKMAADEAAKLVQEKKLDEEAALAIMLAALCHDFGKPATTQTAEDGKIISYGHEEAGVMPAKNFLRAINGANAGNGAAEKVLRLIKDHGFIRQHKDASDAAIRRLAARLFPATIQELAILAEADRRGTGQSLDDFPEAEYFLKKAKDLNIEKEKPKPIILGRDLIEMGFKPGVEIGKILKEVYELQLDGKVSTLEEAKEKAREFLI